MTASTLTTSMDAKQSEWRTEVLALPNATQFVIPAGAYANIKVGDVFAIYNVTHQWDGTPCASNHLGAFTTTTTPLVIARADQVENTGTLLTMVCSGDAACTQGEEKVDIGAKVVVSKLTDDTRVLARLLQINSVTGGTISYTGLRTVK
jgi:hypothetical protein